MLAINKTFGFGSFTESDAITPAVPAAPAVDEGTTQSTNTLTAPAGEMSADLFDPSSFELGNFFDDPTPNLDYSPLSSFSASPEWGSLSLFGDAGVAAGVVDDSPVVRAEDSFDFGFAGDFPLFPAYSAKPADPLPPDLTSFEASLESSSLPFSLPVPSAVAAPENALASSSQAQHPYEPSPVMAPTDFFPSPALNFQSSPLPLHAEPSTTPTFTARPIAGLRRSTGPTGTRKGVAVQQLLPIDAPTQQRTYTSESATSKKKIPAAFEARQTKAKKRKGSKGKGVEDEDEESAAQAGSSTGDLPPSLEDAIKAKRLANTVAARRSRHRKLAHLQGLESLVDILGQERDMLLQFAEAAMAMHPDLVGGVGGWGEKIRGLGGEDGGMGLSKGEEHARALMAEAFGPEDE